MREIYGIYSSRVLSANTIKPSTIVIQDGKIIDVLNGKQEHLLTEDLQDLILLPGVIDPHVHINEPGRTDWEGFETGTKSAAAGGITTIVDMPLNSSPVTIDPESFFQKINSAKDKVFVNSGFWGGLVPTNSNKIEALINEGVLGIKAFLTHSGIDEFPGVSQPDLRKCLKILRNYNLPLLAHAEIDSFHEGINSLKNNPSSYLAYLNSRPREWENKAVRLMISLCQEFNTPVHIVHLSSSDVLKDIEIAKDKGLPLTVETCSHYLFFDAEEIPDGDTRYKCAPPIREMENNLKLWQALDRGVIDFIASDHSPAPPEIKKIEENNFQTGWGGIAGLQFSFQAVIKSGMAKGFKLTDISKWMSTNPGNFLKFKKGSIEKNFDADLIAFDPDLEYVVANNKIFHKHDTTPYKDYSFQGKVIATYLKGKKIYENGKFLTLPQGEIILRK